VTEGAKESQIPPDYQHYLSVIAVYQLPTSAWTKVGAFIFVTLWGPVFQKMEGYTKRTVQEDGNAPSYVIMLVRLVMFVMWGSHDLFFAPVFGRGDGLKTNSVSPTCALGSSQLQDARLLKS
jgi:hypothetical protein